MRFDSFVDFSLPAPKNVRVTFTHEGWKYYTLESIDGYDVVWNVTCWPSRIEEYRKGLLPDGFFVTVVTDYHQMGTPLIAVDEKHYNALKLL